VAPPRVTLTHLDGAGGQRGARVRGAAAPHGRSQNPKPQTLNPKPGTLTTLNPKSLHPKPQTPTPRERLVIYCQTSSVSAAHATHCATYCTPCQPLLRAFSGWIITPPPTTPREQEARRSRSGPACRLSLPMDRTRRGSYLRLIDSCITQLKAQGPSRTCNESKEEKKKTRRARKQGSYRGTSLIRNGSYRGTSLIRNPLGSPQGPRHRPTVGS